ncbi:MAG TPA: hypothetical protein VGM56_12290 [Byssovorax sp.]|jgi:hypothetical protein
MAKAKSRAATKAARAVRKGGATKSPTKAAKAAKAKTPRAPAAKKARPSARKAPSTPREPAGDKRAEPRGALRPKTIPMAGRGAEPPFDAAKARALVGRMRARWPRLDASERRSFEGLSTDDERARVGVRTHAQPLAIEAVRWAISIDRQLGDLAVARDHYDPKRFAYLLERLDALLAALVGAPPDTAPADEGAARAADMRRRLLLALGRYAGKRLALRTLLEAGRGTAANADGLALSLRTLVGLASTWVETGDAFLLSCARLTPRLVEDARALVLSGGDGVDDAGRGARWRAPYVAEGAVAEELERACDDFDAAKRDNDAVRRLEIGPALRAALGPPDVRSIPPPAAPPSSARRNERLGPPSSRDASPNSGPPEEPLA